ncbi:MAG: hypothetical protein EBQ56_00545, partial [Proteobacteria bacterium]|nr:hypothetical protein [Pseudomonadota bacterium]
MIASSPAPVATPTSVRSDVLVTPTGTPVPMGVSSVTVVGTGTASATATVTTAVTASVVPVTTRSASAQPFQILVDGPGGQAQRRLVSVPPADVAVPSPPPGNGQSGSTVQARAPGPVRVQGADGASFVSVTKRCGLTSAGKAYCWGSNWYGQLGDGTSVAERPVPSAVSGGLVFTSLVDSGSHRCGLV